MDFGIVLQWGDFRHIGLSPTLLEVARQADELGFQSLWASDQLTARGNPAFSIDPLIALASLMHAVPDMQLGTGVLVLPQRNTADVAKQAASLANLSSGRFLLGVGAGWNQAEFQLSNVDFATRGQKMDEALEVMRLLWHEDGATFDSQFHSFDGVTMLPKPPEHSVPLWIGGNSNAAIQRAARVGDAWFPAAVTPKALSDGVTLIRQLRGTKPMPTIATMLMVHAQTSEDEVVAPMSISGSADEMVSSLQAYKEAGLEHLVCSFNSDNMVNMSQQMQLFAENVMPHFGA